MLITDQDTTIRTDLPQDDNMIAMQIVPAKKPLKVTYNASINSQFEVTLQPATSFVEVHAKNGDICIRYKTAAGGTAVSAATDGFHELIAAGTTRQYGVPMIAGVRVTVFAFIAEDSTASAVLTVIEK